MNIVLLGKIGSGKTTICNNLTENFRYDKIVTTTTRPIRKNEENGIDYFFVEDKEFDKMLENNELILTTNISGYKYGLNKRLLVNAENKIIIVDPNGLKELNNILNFKFISIYVMCESYKRYIRCLDRGDNKKDILTRMDNECVVFDSLKTDYVVCNSSEDIWNATINVLEYIKESIDCLHQNYTK